MLFRKLAYIHIGVGLWRSKIGSLETAATDISNLGAVWVDVRVERDGGEGGEREIRVVC